MNHLLSKSFARALYETKGLLGVALPSGVFDEENALYELTRHANLLWCSERGETPSYGAQFVPFAVLFLKSNRNFVPEFPVFSQEGELAQFRLGNRLFVGTSRELATFTSTIKIGVGDNYPSNQGQNGSLELRSLATSILIEICAELDINPKQSISSKMISALTNILEIFAITYEDAGAVIVDWNAVWFDHINLSLNQLLDGLKRMGKSLDFQSFVTDFLYASFSLPIPNKGFDKKYSKPSQTKSAINNAINLYWSSANEVEMSLAMLRNSPEVVASGGDEGHPLALLDWSNFDDTISSERVRGSNFLAWAIHENNANGRLQYFSKLTEDQFFDPRRVTSGALRVVDPKDGAIVYQLDGSSVHIISGTIFEEGKQRFVTPNIQVLVPLKPNAEVSVEDVVASSSRVIPKGGVFEGQLVPVNEVVFEGVIAIDIPGRGANLKYSPKVNALAIQLDPSDSLVGKIEQAAKASFVVTPPGALGAFIFAIRPNGVVESPRIVSQSEMVDGSWLPLETQEIEVDTNRNYQVVLFGDRRELEASLNGKPVSAIPDSNYLWVTDPFAASGLDRLVIGELVIVLTSSNDSTHAPESPIIAAIEKLSHARTDPKSVHQESIRGDLEDYYSKLVVDGQWHASLGHVVLASDQLGLVEDIEVGSSHQDFEMTAEMFASWKGLGLPSVSTELKESSESIAFQKAFSDLGVRSQLSRKDDQSGESFGWVSKTSWAHLIDQPQLLNNYLSCYEGLVKKANELGDRIGRIWAAYPFSVSIWQTSNAPKLLSVLLSPLHPIRLSWLAQMEHSLRRAANARQFCGTVEGWNLPIVGPSNTANGKLMAVPCDIDSDQLFVGWSMMIDVSINGHDVLKAPTFGGSRKLPGISNAGLNANTVRDALKDFRRLHPHVATLTIDMSARSKSPKLHEMDAAVISEFTRWVTEERTGRGLVGGVRVFDSLNREGPQPEFMGRARSASEPNPITWKRYQSNPQIEIEANIRILQDSGIAVEITEDATKTFGVLGSIPFRRFEIPESTHSVRAGEVQYRPALVKRDEAGSFYKALRTLESPREMLPSIGLQIQGNGPLLGAAQWTISGESMISPAALAAILAANVNVRQMLWEWHPPFLGDGGSSGVNASIEKRSYFTLAQIPRLLQGKLRSKLKFLLGRETTEIDVRNVFGTLGSRGIGLSALIAAGGSQLTGALGFYSVFALDGVSNSLKKNRFIMPIDACNQFLSNLMGSQIVGRDKKRADLLVIEITETSICLTPIEIKFYGTEDTPPFASVLPQSGSNTIKKASLQASSTGSMLRALKASWEESQADLGNDNNHLLKANALASFIEAAMRINPDGVETDVASKSLQAIIDGSITIDLGMPLVAFFIPTDSDEKVSVGLDVTIEDGQSHAEFICDPRAAMQQIEAGSGLVIDEWNRALDWSLRTRPLLNPTFVDQDLTINTDDDMSADESDDSDVVVTSEDVLGDVGSGSEEEISDQMNVEDESEAVTGGLQVDQENVELTTTPQEPSQMVPEILNEGVKFPVGTLVNTNPATSAQFWPGNTALSQLNIGVVGNLGTGKTQLVKSLITQLRSTSGIVQPEPLTMLVLDYKHDYQDPVFLEAVGGRVLKPHKIPLDIFRVVGEDNQPNRYKRANAFVDVIKKIYGGVGPVQTNRLKQVIMGIYSANSGSPTLELVAQAYSELVPNGDAVVGILNNFVMQEIFSSSSSDLKTLGELIDGSVLVLDLRELDPDQATKNALVALFLNQYFEYMIQLTKWPFENRENMQLRRLNSYIVVDEATNIMEYDFDALSALLLQGREYGVGVLLSSQFLSHFVPTGGPNYAEPLLTWFIHQVPNVTVSDLRKIGFLGATDDDATRISNLPVHGAFYKSLNYPGRFMRGLPFFELGQ